MFGFVCGVWVFSCFLCLFVCLFVHASLLGLSGHWNLAVASTIHLPFHFAVPSRFSTCGALACSRLLSGMDSHASSLFATHYVPSFKPKLSLSRFSCVTVLLLFTLPIYSFLLRPRCYLSGFHQCHLLSSLHPHFPFLSVAQVLSTGFHRCHLSVLGGETPPMAPLACFC